MQNTEYRIQNTKTHVHKTTYGPLIDMGMYVMLFMQANPLIGQVGGSWAMAILTWRDAISQGQKSLISGAQHPPTCPRNASARIKSITHGSINSYWTPLGLGGGGGESKQGGY